MSFFPHLKTAEESVVAQFSLWFPPRPHGIAWFLLCRTWTWFSNSPLLCPSAQRCH